MYFAKYATSYDVTIVFIMDKSMAVYSCESLLGYEAIGLTVMNTKWIDNDYPTRSVLFIGVRFMRHSTNACIIHTTNLCIISIKSIVTKQSVINHKYAHH